MRLYTVLCTLNFPYNICLFACKVVVHSVEYMVNYDHIENLVNHKLITISIVD